MQVNLAATQPYNLDVEIARITELNQAGKKVHLLIGRTPEEELPIEEGVIWVSLDKCGPEFSLKDRIHLKINFQDDELLAKINHLFDKVIVDTSTMKFFTGDPWRKMALLLKSHPEATVITEAEGKGEPIQVEEKKETYDIWYPVPAVEMLGDIQLSDQLFDDYVKEKGPERIDQEYDDYLSRFDPDVVADFRNSDPEALYNEFKCVIKEKLLQEKSTVIEKKCARINLERNINYLKTLFDSVEYIDNQGYPIDTRFGEVRHPHFILRGPKTS